MGRPKGGGSRKDIRMSSDEGDCDGRQHAGNEDFQRLAVPPGDENSMTHPLNSSFWDQDCPAMTYTDSDFDFLTGFTTSNDESLGSPRPPEVDNEMMNTMCRAVNHGGGPSLSGHQTVIKGSKSDYTIPLRLSQLQLQLQQQLQRLAALSISRQNVEFQSLCGSRGENRTLSEALTGEETLMLIIEALRENQGLLETGDSEKNPLRPLPIPDDAADWPSFSDSLHQTDHITVLLQVLMCYMQLIQIYNHLLTLIECDLQHAGTPVASVQSNNATIHDSPATFLSNTVFTFGQFSLAFHVDLKAHVTVQLVSSMLKRIQRSLDTVMNNSLFVCEDEPQITDRAELTSRWRKQELSCAGITQTSSPMLLAAKAAVNQLHLEEKKVLDRLKEMESR